MARGEENSGDTVLSLVERGLEALSAAKVEDALTLCLEARAIDSASPEHLYLMGLISMRVNRMMDAIECMLEGHRLAPEYREFSAALAKLFAQHGKLVDSLYYSKLAHAQVPHPLLSRFEPKTFANSDAALESVNLQGYYQDAYVAFMMKDLMRAKELCESHLRLNPYDRDTLRLYGQVLVDLHLFREATVSLGAALNLGDEDPDLPAILSVALAGAGDFEQAVGVGREAVRLAPDSWDVLGRVIQAWESLPDGFFDARAEMVEHWRLRVEALARPDLSLPPTPSVVGRNLRIGYLINEYAAAHYLPQIEAVLGAHSPRVDAHVYQLFLNNPEALSRLSPHARVWRELADVDDETAAAIIRGAGIDVLVDLCSMTPGARPEIIGSHPAPLQVSWLAGEASAAGIDFVLADPISRNALPPGTRVLELSGGVFCQPRGRMLVAQAEAIVPPASTNGFVTFGATLDLARVIPSLDLWARLLNTLPSTRLLLGNVPAISADALRRLNALAEPLGISERILIDDPSESSDLDSFWGRVDVALTPVDAPDVFEVALQLALGLPVVGRHGIRLAHARAVGLFAEAGQDHWIARDDDHYIEIASAMAASPEAAATLRRDLVTTIGRMPLCNVSDFTLAFEDALIQAVLTGG
jgi:tetratricopeptide (TPR) repeat protein